MLIAFLVTNYPKLTGSEKEYFPSEITPREFGYDWSSKNLFATFSEADAGHCALWQKLAGTGLLEEAFNYAMKGYAYLKEAKALNNRNIISIVDFSKPSTQKRLYVLDIKTGNVLYNTLVAHGRNSGNEYATQFSNKPESRQSSLGFYLTLGTYMGSHGYSLKLKGCEKGINDKAYERSVVTHGANYVSNAFMNSRGFLGRSYGCPSLPEELHKEIIDTIKKGTCLFLYHPSKKYYNQSKILNS